MVGERLTLRAAAEARDTIAQDIRQSEAMLAQAKEQLKDGTALAQGAKKDLMESADPLGSPPEEPRSWSETAAMQQRSEHQVSVLQAKINDAKKVAKEHGIDLDAPAPQAVLLQAPRDSYGEKQDKQLLEFLARY